MIWTRKLGVFELLLGAVVFELVLGSKARALVAGAFAVLAWYTKRKFQGEFSMAEAWSVVFDAGSKAAKKVDETIN